MVIQTQTPSLLMCSLNGLARQQAFRAPALEKNDYGDQSNNREDRSGPDRVHRGNRIFPSRRIVVVTEQQDLVYRRADFAFRSLNQPESQILWHVLYPVQISRDFSLRSQNHNAARVRVLAGN